MDPTEFLPFLQLLNIGITSKSVGDVCCNREELENGNTRGCKVVAEKGEVILTSTQDQSGISTKL